MAAGQSMLRVLVVENEVLIRLCLEELIKDMGHELVGWATTAEAAIAEAEATRPDLILMDVELDGPSDGIEAARRIVERLGIVSLFTTGSANSETRRRTVSFMNLGILEKPVTSQRLEEAFRFLPKWMWEQDPSLAARYRGLSRPSASRAMFPNGRSKSM